MKEDKRILLISFYFAPDSKVGGKRFSFLSRLLEKKYPELHVLTVNEKHINPKDNSLSSGGIVHRVGMYPAYPARTDTDTILKKVFNRFWTGFLCLVDPYSGWILPALYTGRNVIKQHQINLIIATGPPFSTLVIGWLLSVITGTRLVLDYRDPWANPWSLRKSRSAWIKGINTILEKVIVKKASAIVFCTPMMKHGFSQWLGKYTRADLYVIYNAYDNNNDGIQPKYLSENKINMVYAGQFYGERKINLLTEPLIRLLDEGVITETGFCLHIFGKLSDQDRKTVKQYDLQDIIIEHALIPYRQLISYLKGAHILVLIISKNMCYSVSYKFYDYLSVKNPIFAIVPDNSQMQTIMQETDCGRTAIINRPEDIYQHLRAMLLEHRQYSFTGAERFTWSESGRQYSELIEAVITN